MIGGQVFKDRQRRQRVLLICTPNIHNLITLIGVTRIREEILRPIGIAYLGSRIGSISIARSGIVGLPKTSTRVVVGVAVVGALVTMTSMLTVS